MHKKICIWCGTEFECQYSHRKLCSASCKKQHDAEHHRKYRDEHPEMVAEWERRKRKRRKIKDVRCRVCGKVVPPVVGNHHRWYHDECIIEEGLKALSEGASMSEPRLKRCSNRLGYSKAELLEELEWKQNLEK